MKIKVNGEEPLELSGLAREVKMESVKQLSKVFSQNVIIDFVVLKKLRKYIRCKTCKQHYW